MSEPEYYMIEVRDDTWVVVLNHLLARHKKADDAQVVVNLTQEGNAVYYISKELVPLKAMAAALGVSPDQLARVQRVVLKKIKAEQNWQKPTVPYIGEA